MPTTGTFADVTFTERVRVPWTWWLIAVGLLVSLVVAVFAYIPPAAATIFTIANAIVVVGALLLYTLRIDFDGSVLQVGNNRLETQYMAEAEAFEGEEAQRILGVDADVRNYLVTRPFTRDVVRITLDDPADSHPAWLVSTRRAREFADAINKAVQA